MKILDRYILTSFVKTFFSVFAILFFIFVLQGIWVFIGDLAGKDLDFITIFKFLFFYSPKMIPMVLPLSVLLASIMTFGDFSENYEFAAMKSSGISLQRAMRSLIIFIFILSGLSFWFINNVAPKSEFKFVNMRRDIIHTKPAMAISAGQFNSLGALNIKVEEKYGEKDEQLRNVTMHVINQQNSQNKTVIKAKTGKIETNENSPILKLHLFDGNYYEDVTTRRSSSNEPFIKSDFKHYIMSIDVSEFDKSEEELQEISNTANMMNISQLAYTIDSLDNNLKNEIKIQADADKENTRLFLSNTPKEPEITYKTIRLDSLLKQKKYAQKISLYSNAVAVAENIKFNITNNKNAVNEKEKHINRHWVALYEKFVIAFSCLLMFFIGAPLGAIIRKGGLGLPMVFAVLIFITYHFINTFGKKLAQENGITPFFGAWLSTLILLPMAITFTYKATRDRGINSIDNLLYPLTNYLKTKFKKKQNNIENV
ncbi:LptF/LptG family permease [Paenimyroides aestuarii]|uniref:LptF/LptG family permease n=1 Tax=Paenimyroides aestuarii TaxID=2968490 RepID=A0ABY5NPS5_9FLAO|nr:LptF/LptG family permease [Paenimyroides aestuarii]UUV20571.1 LptF/LptG family permease [Paenimyroides aestuarii]